MTSRSLSRSGEFSRAGTLYLGSGMRIVQDLVQRLAPTDLTIVLLGETGTGKDLVARDIHCSSSRAAGQFCVLNCAAIPATLIEGTLFGHERGAFTGAERTRPGIFEQAHGGTVFLDEVGELSAAAQAALLRVLETGRVARIGGSSELDVDARVVAATHRDLEDMVRQGMFRSDLLHRLSMATIELPPLRERRDEIAPLARHFLREHPVVRDLHPLALARLEEYDWPGNVRELRNAVARAAALASGPLLTEGDLLLRAPEAARGVVTAPRVAAPFRTRLASLARAEVQVALEKTGGHQRRAAELLGMPLRTLERHVQKLREIDSTWMRTSDPVEPQPAQPQRMKRNP